MTQGQSKGYLWNDVDLLTHFIYWYFKHLLSTRVLGKLIPALTKGTGRLKQAAHVAES